MKKLILILIVLALIGWGAKSAYEYITTHTGIAQPAGLDQIQGEKINRKSILRFALVADSHNDNEHLAKALNQITGTGVNFVIGLGDYTETGTDAEIVASKKIFENSKLKYYTIAGDHDLWDSRNQKEHALDNFRAVFGQESQVFSKENVDFILVDNSDIYKGIDDEKFNFLAQTLKKSSKLKFVFAHKTPFHPTSGHVMGEDSENVAKQAEHFLNLMEQNRIDGFFSGDLHFFAEFKSPNNAVRITTIGAVDSERNFQGPRFAIVTVFDDYSWEVEDAEIR